jgi:integrase
MARTIHRLSPAKVMNAKVGRYADGGGLYLQVVPLAGGGLGRSWFFRYAAPSGATRISKAGLEHRAERQMGLGPTHTISLAEAREAAREARKLLLQGVDPLDAKTTQRASQRVARARGATFNECATAFVASRESTWRNEVHRRQWTTTLSTYAGPIIGALPVEAVDTALVMKVLGPLWQRAPETGSRLRGRIELVLNWATVAGHRSGENPARWRGHLEHLLPARRKLVKVKHLAAMPYRDVPAFMAALREEEGEIARALEIVTLTACRLNEALGAQWSEVDLREKHWIVPAERTKTHVEHRIPLSSRVAEILAVLPRTSEYVFPFSAPHRLRSLLAQLAPDGATVHGFRSSFRDWCGEQTNFPRELCEQALAHRVGNAVENAYRRGDLLEKRRQLMDAWADYCARPTTEGQVVPMRRA